MNDMAPIQTAIYAALTANPATYPVYDPVPQGVPKPYIAIGEWTIDNDEEIAAATSDATINLHTWSAKNSKAESHAMLQFIRSRLDNSALPLTPIGGTWGSNEDFAEVMEDAGSSAASRIYHGVARYRVRVG